MIALVKQFDTDSSLEYQYDVRTAEKEVTHILTSFKTVADGATREANCRNISSTYLCESGHGLPQYALSEGTSSVG